jgi:hypothetical protein
MLIDQKSFALLSPHFIFSLLRIRMALANQIDWMDIGIDSKDEIRETLENAVETLDRIDMNALRIPKNVVADLLIDTGQQLTLNLN